MTIISVDLHVTELLRKTEARKSILSLPDKTPEMLTLLQLVR